MPTKLEDAFAIASQMSAVELDCLKGFMSVRQTKLRQADTKCHLLDLPAELRNRVYSYVAANHCRNDRGLGKKMLRPPALLRVNKQIRKKFFSLYYSKDFFRITIFDPRTTEWTDVSDQHLIKAIREERLCKIDRAAVLTESLESCAERIAGFSNMLSGVLDMEHVGVRRQIRGLPYSILGPCFETV